ncbi:MAG: tetratricopeptide repeat protein [Deltaproteobacteria bacterium]|nr:tetratricopeptide repeat protein [Deltaproteobacteria bacterium]MBW2415149.1 tetratricopeptide repeat protein [Deltaproteobacteria bacterium]
MAGVEGSTQLRSLRWAPIALVLAVFALYASSCDRGFVYDDHEVILVQHAPASAGEVLRIFAERHIVGLPYYRPITRASLLLQKAAHGHDPAPFHLFNAALMAAIAGLAYVVLRLPALGVSRAPALLAAAMLAMHPVASSCVYPIASGRETAMPSLFMLASLWGWLRGGRSGAATAWAAFAAALLCKEQAVVIPVVFALADALGLSGPAERSPRAWSLRYAPAVVLGVLYAALRSQLFGGSELVLGHLLGPVWSYGYALQVLVAPTAALVYEPALDVWVSFPRLALAGLAAAALGVAVWRSGAHSGVGSGERRGVLLFWVGWFAIVQLPTANLLQQEAPFDERYVFLASLGPWAMIATLASGATHRLAGRAALAAALVAVAAAAWITAGRASSFASDEAFFQAWHRASPRSIEANAHLGQLRLEQGRIGEAARLYERAVEISPGSASAWLGLGRVRAAEGREADALAHYERAVALEPGSGLSWFQLGVARERSGDPESAERAYREALRFKPNLAEAHFNLGVRLERSGRDAEAMDSYREALRYRPAFAAAHYNLGNALARSGAFDQAIPHYRAALALEPDHEDARRNLALAVSSAGTPGGTPP